MIVILIKHNIILWHQADDTELPYYQIDWHAAYVLARQSRVTRLVDSRHGKKSRDILQNIMLLGTVQVGDLEGEYDLDILGSDSKRDSGIESAQAQSSADAGIANGFPDVEGCFVDDKDDGTITTAASFHNTLRSLLEEGFLMKINLDRDHVPAADLEDHLRNEVVSANSRDFPGGKITGPKTAEKFAVAANLLKRKWQAEAEYSSQRDVASQGSIKRGHSGKTHSNKRRKVNGNLTNGEYHDHADEMSENEEELPAAAPLRRLPVCCNRPCLDLAWLTRRTA